MPNGIPHPYLLDDSISNFRVVGGIFHFHSNFKKETSVSKQWRTGSDAAFFALFSDVPQKGL